MEYARDGKDTKPLHLEWKHTKKKSDDAFTFLRRMLELGADVSVTDLNQVGGYPLVE